MFANIRRRNCLKCGHEIGVAFHDEFFNAMPLRSQNLGGHPCILNSKGGGQNLDMWGLLDFLLHQLLHDFHGLPTLILCNKVIVNS